jgi:hypothetical protein
MTGRSHESVTRIGWLPAKFEARLGTVAILRCMSPFVGRVSDAGRLRDGAACSAAGVRKPPRKMLWGGGEDIAYPSLLM